MNAQLPIQYKPQGINYLMFRVTPLGYMLGYYGTIRNSGFGGRKIEAAVKDRGRSRPKDHGTRPKRCEAGGHEHGGGGIFYSSYYLTIC